MYPAAHTPDTPDKLAALSPVPVLASPQPGSDLVTELVAGETLLVLEIRGGWRRVVVPAHASSLDERGYPGWSPPDAALVSGENWIPDLVVARPNRAGLPLGALLRGTDGGAALPGGESVDLDSGDAIPAGEPAPLPALSLCRELIGLPYRWGGTDSTAGMDCSGLVYRVMQLLGIRVPRDSDDQWDLAPFKRSGAGADSRESRVGDLVFFGESSVTHVTHVGFYLGHDRYISSHGCGGISVRALTDDPYLGFARYDPL